MEKIPHKEKVNWFDPRVSWTSEKEALPVALWNVAWFRGEETTVATLWAWPQEVSGERHSGCRASLSLALDERDCNVVLQGSSLHPDTVDQSSGRLVERAEGGGLGDAGAI